MAIFFHHSRTIFTPWNVFLFVVFFIQIFLFSFTNSIDFQISRFSPEETRILYQGDATPTIGQIELNRIDYINRVGLAIYSERVPLWDLGSRRLTDFTTHFTFIIDTRNRPTGSYGHGLVFFLAPFGFQIPPNSAGGFLGLFNTTTTDSPRTQIVAVEFDSFPNPEWDPSYEHVGINNNSLTSSVNTPWNASLHSGDTADAWIIYNATSRNLSVFWSYGGNSPNSSLSYQIDLMQVLPEWVSVGFAASTGINFERHILLSWEFSSNLEIEQRNVQNKRKIGLILGLTISGCFLILIAAAAIAIALIFKKRRKPEAKATNLTSINKDLERGAGPRRFSYKDLALATNNFSKERKLGQGGFGEVYKGHLVDLDKAVAVKKISRDSRQGLKEFTTEVKIISSLRHRNLVQLIGWCHDDRGEFLLVYEFMRNGSLDVHLFGKKDPLSWALRYKIALGLASALLYLHEEWEQCVIHRDIKSSNIMLDLNFNVKLGDFGLARLMDHELGPQTTGLAGTLGYLAPEYISTGRASKESDVYSFGVVSIEIASGRKSSDTMSMDKESETGLVEGVWNLYGRGGLLSAVDERLKDGFDFNQVERLLMVGLWCAHPDRSLRPSIKQAIQVLNFEAPLPQLPTQIPVPTYHAFTSPVVSSGEPLSASITIINDGR